MAQKMQISSFFNRNCRFLVRKCYERSFANYTKGADVPIQYVKDAPKLTLASDEEYPSWVFDLAKKPPTKEALLRVVKDKGVEALSLYENKRLQQLITKSQIKTFNAEQVEGET